MKKINTTYVIAFVGLILIVLYTVSQLARFDKTDLKAKDSRYRLFYKLFERLGYQTKHWTGKAPPDSSGLVIYFNYQGKDKVFLDQLIHKVKEGGTLLLAGIESDLEPVQEKDMLKGQIGAIKVHDSLAEDVQELAIVYGRYFHKDMEGKVLLSASDKPILLEIKAGKGTIYLLSDSSLFKDFHMKDENVAVLINNLLKPFYEDKLYILHGEHYSSTPDHGAEDNLTLIRKLFQGKLFFIAIHLILMGVLFILWKGKRFGKTVLLNSRSRRSLAEHLSAVGLFYRKAKSTHIVEQIQTQHFVFRLRKLLGISYPSSEKVLIEAGTKRLNVDKESLTRLVQENHSSESELISREKEREKVIESIRSKHL